MTRKAMVCTCRPLPALACTSCKCTCKLLHGTRAACHRSSCLPLIRLRREESYLLWRDMFSRQPSVSSQEQWALDPSIVAACVPSSKACADPAILFSPSGSFIDFRIQPEGAAILEYLSKGEKVSTFIPSSAAMICS